MVTTLMQALDARPSETEFKFPEITPVIKPAPFSPDLTPKLEYFPLEDYSTLKDWIEAIARAQWDHIEEELLAFFGEEGQWVSYPKEAPIPYESGWYFHDGLNPGWQPLLAIDQIPTLMVADTESCRQTEESPYRPFLFGGLTRYGWYMWHCNDNELPSTVPFPAGRIVIGHNFSDYDSRFLSCEQSIANGRQTTILDTLSMVTRYQGLSNQQTGRYKAAHARATQGKTADSWYAHACEGGLDHAVEKLLGIKIDKGVRDAMEKNLWMQLYDVEPPQSIFEYWAQDVVSTARLAKKLYMGLRYNFLPSTATWVGMAEMAGCRVWLKDWEGFLEDSDKKWKGCKDYLAGVVKERADLILQDSDSPVSIPQFKEKVRFESDTADWFEAAGGEEDPDILVRELPDGVFDISIFPMDKDRSFVFRPGPDGKTFTFGMEPEPSEGYLKKERALHQALKRISTDPICLPLEQGDLITKLAAIFTDFKPAPNKSGCFDWTPARSGASKGQPKWYKDLSSTGTKKNPKNPFSIGTQIAVYLLEICWDDEPIRYRKIGKKGGWVDHRGVPLPHPTGGENLGTPFCKDYLAYATAGKLTSRVLPQEDLIEIYRNILLSGQWTQFRSRYHDVYTHDSEFEGLKFVKPAINPAGTVTGRAKSGVWVVTPNEKEIFDGSIKIGSDIQNCVVAPPGYKVVGADFTSQESWLATLLTDAQAGKVASSPWCRSVLYGNKAQRSDIHNIVATALNIDRSPAKGLNFGCVPVDNSQALTRDGWKYVKDLEPGVEIMTYDPDLDLLQWGALENLSIHCNEEIIEVSNDDYTIESTANHRWWGERHRKSKNIKAHWVEEEFTTDKFNTVQRIKMSAPFEEKDGEFLDIGVKDAALVGLLLTDGWFKWNPKSMATSTSHGTRRGCNARIFQSKEENIEFFEWACSDITRTKTIQKGWSQSGNAKDVTVWLLSSRDFRDLWKRCELDPDDPDYSKFILKLSPSCLAKFLEAIVRADATTHPCGSFSIDMYESEQSKQDAFVLAAVLMGYKLHFSRFKSTGSNPSEPYRIYFRAVPYRYMSGQRIKKRVSRCTDVWCPTVKTGFWLMRQNGAITITGNSQYGAGIQKLAILLMLAGIPVDAAEQKAKDFVTLLKGPEGLARTMFGTLRELSQISAIRTAILGCRVPESLDHIYCGRNFITTRQNWLIQSAGVDCIHTLLTILNTFLIEYEIDAILLLHRHDAVYFAVKEGQEKLFTRCLQQAHYLTKQLAYEQAVEQANQLNKAKGHTVFIPTPPLECPDSQKWFDEVKVVDCVGAAG